MLFERTICEIFNIQKETSIGIMHPPLLFLSIFFQPKRLFNYLSHQYPTLYLLFIFIFLMKLQKII